MMDLEAGGADSVILPQGERPAIRIQMATAEELGEHERVLAEIDKASKGSTLWRQLAI
jgi:DNA polymerase III subunit epsilon